VTHGRGRKPRWSSVKKANCCGASLGSLHEWPVFVGYGKTELCVEVFGGGESFEGHEIEPDTIINQARHRPCQFSQREQVDGVGKACHGLDRFSSHRGVRLTEGAGEHPDHGAITEGPTKTVVPQAGGEDPTTARAELMRFVVEQDA
jgi:hypothetical protein